MMPFFLSKAGPFCKSLWWVFVQDNIFLEKSGRKCNERWGKGNFRASVRKLWCWVWSSFLSKAAPLCKSLWWVSVQDNIFWRRVAGSAVRDQVGALLWLGVCKGNFKASEWKLWCWWCGGWVGVELWGEVGLAVRTHVLCIGFRIETSAISWCSPRSLRVLHCCGSSIKKCRTKVWWTRPCVLAWCLRKRGLFKFLGIKSSPDSENLCRFYYSVLVRRLVLGRRLTLVKYIEQPRPCSV